MRKSPIAALLLALTFSAVLFAAERSPNTVPLDYRCFTSGQSIWIWDHTSVLLYRNDAKTVKHLLLSDSLPFDTVFDVVENDNALWMVASSGLYQVDMGTATAERIPGGPSYHGRSAIAADIDFIWIARQDTLWKFDKLSREWFAFPIGKTAPPGTTIIGAHSDGAKVYCIASSNVLHFSISDEKWTSYPLSGFSFSSGAAFHRGSSALAVVEGDKLYRYIIAKLSWDVVTAPSGVIDAHFSDDRIAFLTQNGSFDYSAASSILRPFDIPDAKNARCISLLNDTTIMLSGEKSLVAYYTTTRTTENIPYPPNSQDGYPLKIINGDMLLYPREITIYNRSTRTWEVFSLPGRAVDKNIFVWDENGFRTRYAPGFESQLRGNMVQQSKIVDGGYLRNEYIDSTFDSSENKWVFNVITTDSVRAFYYSPGEFGDDLYSDLTLHTTLSKSRYADLFFTKEAGNPPEKGLFYRGDADDRFESARIGTNTHVLPLSQTMPSVNYEGAGAIVHTKSELSTRDRKIARVQAGAGLRTTQTRYTILEYNREGEYTIGRFDSTEHFMIVPGSLKINVDGEDIDTLSYSFVPITGNLTFQRRDLLDPTSVIIASYKVQTIPDSGLETIEFLPENHFGRMEVASASVSPTDWVSAQGAYTSLQDNPAAPRRAIANFMLPFEFRKPKPDLLLKLTPEFSMETGAGAKASALGLQSRIGRWYLGKATSFFLNTSIIDTSFTTTDTLSRGYGRLHNNLDLKIGHDIMTELPLLYSQSNRASQYGTERYRQASTGVHFQNFPYLDLLWSKNSIDVDNTNRVTPGDSSADSLILNREKSKIKLRLYELSSTHAQHLLNLNKFGYDLSYIHFTSCKESRVLPDSGTRPLPGAGDIFSGSVTLNPISSITISGLTTLKKNTQDSLADTAIRIKQANTEISPTVTIQTIDAPPGIDLSANYSADYLGRSFSDSGAVAKYDSGQVAIQRKFFIIMKPGTWTRYLSWMSPRFGLSENLNCLYDSTAPASSEILLGTHGTAASSLTKSFGVHLYPTGDIVIRLENDYTTLDSITNYHMFNDIKWWFGANRLWQTRYELNSIGNGPMEQGSMHKLFTFFDATWCSWIRSNEKLAADYSRRDSSYALDSITDTTITNSLLVFGPETSVSFSLQRKGPIKLLLNGHTAKFAWRRLYEKGEVTWSGSFSYSTFARIIVKPNISFEVNTAIAWASGIVTYNGDLSCGFLF